MTITGTLFKFISEDQYVCLRVGVEALEGDGWESETSDCPLARPQGEPTYRQDDLYLAILTFEIVLKEYDLAKKILRNNVMFR